MTTVFIAGSIAIKKLNPMFVKRLANIVESQHDVVLGDADGADSFIQKALYELGSDRERYIAQGLSHAIT